MTFPADGVSGATRAPGPQKVVFSGAKGPLKDLKPGQYNLVVEAAREVGGHEAVRVPFTWGPREASRRVRHRQGDGRTRRRHRRREVRFRSREKRHDLQEAPSRRRARRPCPDPAAGRPGPPRLDRAVGHRAVGRERLGDASTRPSPTSCSTRPQPAAPGRRGRHLPRTARSAKIQNARPASTARPSTSSDQARHLQDRLGSQHRDGQLHRERRGQALPRFARGLRQAGPGRRRRPEDHQELQPQRDLRHPRQALPTDGVQADRQGPGAGPGDPPQRPGRRRGRDLQVPARRQARRRPGSDDRPRRLALSRHAGRRQGEDRRRRRRSRSPCRKPACTGSTPRCAPAASAPAAKAAAGVLGAVRAALRAALRAAWAAASKARPRPWPATATAPATPPRSKPSGRKSHNQVVIPESLAEACPGPRDRKRGCPGSRLSASLRPG
jgi:hypothetical protein